MAIKPVTPSAGKRAAELFTAAGGGRDKPRDNFIKRLFHGGFSLTVTFWIFCVSVPLVAHLVFSRLIFPVLDVHTWYGSTIFLIWPALALLYAGVAYTGLWRSRTSFAGNPLWPNLAGLAALLGAAGAAVYAVVIVGSWFMLTTV